MPSLTFLHLCAGGNLVSAWVLDDVIDVSFKTFFITATLALFLAQQVSKRFILKERKHKNELFMWVKSKCTWYKCLISFSPTSFHMLCPAWWCSSNGITKYILISQQSIMQWYLHKRDISTYIKQVKWWKIWRMLTVL